jgi:RimJ/RimL family protein N-acetyltransferase
VLRPFALADAETVAALAGDRAIAATTLSIPHPYAPADAEDWIATHPADYRKGCAVSYAITLPEGSLCGSVGLGLSPEHNFAELGYWIGRPFWGNGYATEAAVALVDFAFGSLGLNRINSTHFSDNPASGRVMQKLGMVQEGYRARYTRKWGVYRDIVLYGLLREDWLRSPSGIQP